MNKVRLTDANALIRRVNENEFYTDKLKAVLCAIVDTSPTVDAVPVEWIQGFMNWLDGKGYTIASAVIQKMLNDFRADGERRADGK